MRIPSEGAISGLVMRDDPDWLATRDFQKVFPEGQFVLLLLESSDPFQPAALADADALAAALTRVPELTVVSVVDTWRRAHPGFAPTPEGAEALRRFATGTKLAAQAGAGGRPVPRTGRRLPVEGRQGARRVACGDRPGGGHHAVHRGDPCPQGGRPLRGVLDRAGVGAGVGPLVPGLRPAGGRAGALPLPVGPLAARHPRWRSAPRWRWRWGRASCSASPSPWSRRWCRSR